MKQKMSISVEDSKIKLIERLVSEGVFRNKSHAVENALDNMLRGKNE